MSLFVFVDALPYDFIRENQGLPAKIEARVASHVPSFGYSSNLHWEIFANLYPDQIGFFTDWNYKSTQKIEQKKKPKTTTRRFLSLLEKAPYLAFLLRYGGQKMGMYKYANIPFYVRRYFQNTGKYLLSNSRYVKENSFLSAYQLFLQDELKLPDEKMLEMAKDGVHSGEKNIFIALGFADRLGHIHGRGPAYDRRILPYLNKVLELAEAYRQKHQEGEYVIFSDHGMSRVIRHHKIVLEKIFGYQDIGTYLYFCDSVFLRVWSKDKKRLDAIRAYLEELKIGTVLNDGERKDQEITDVAFGDLIFVLEKGHCFKPNYFGIGLRHEAAGMHGYYPGADDRAGVVLSNIALKETYGTRELYGLLRDHA